MREAVVDIAAWLNRLGLQQYERQMEQALAERPSEPQAHFGAAVAELQVGF
jgi:hypothetical protein